MSILPDPMSEGERRKREAHSWLETHREQLILRARRALLVSLLVNRTATIDSVRAVVPLPPGVNPKAFGPVPGALARAGIIRRATFQKTVRSEGHARQVTVWELADRAAAVAWLAANPAPSQPEPAVVELADDTDPFAI